KCLQLIKDLSCDALLLLNESNMHYLCGFSPSEGVVLLLKNGNSYHIVDSRYTEAAENYAKETGLSVIEAASKFSDTVTELCKKNSVKAIAYENETITLKSFNIFKEATQCAFIGIDDRLMKIRNVKSEEEIDLMIQANDIAEKSFIELLNFVKAGKSEKELQAHFDYLMAKNGSDGLSFSTILLSGAHTSLPHGVPSDKSIERGDFVLFDFGATYKGYHSDMTRTIAVESATDEMKEMYSLVLKAQLAGISALKSGIRCADVYQAAYNVLEEQKMGKYFRHSLGHGVGLDIHEGYSSSPKSKDVFETGNVTSVEPGIYIPDKFGIRIEDVCIVTENGCRNISTVDKNLLII
ncbi:MAG: Xaa-Pro peptidase family protein, partial [Eubacterium sp.]|nr:Xaa-Pro peptidase family protein [Eubacterium sp.]